MFRFKLDFEFGRVKDETPEPEHEPLPGGTHGGAQVEDAGYGSRPAGWTGTGFTMPESKGK